MFNLFKIFFNPVWLCENVFTLYGGGKGGAPKAPNYKALAEQQAQAQLDAIRAQTAANRVNQYTPYGNLEFATSGKDSYGNDLWKANLNLSPEQKQILDQQNQVSIGLGGSMNKSLDYLNNNLSNPFDTSRLPAEQINAGQTVQDAIMSRLNPQFDRMQQQQDAKLANQGIAQGTEAYKNAQMDLGNQRNDAYIQAALQGMNTGQQARQQALQEQMTLRNEPLNTLNALRSGSQVQTPNFVNPALQGATQGVDYMGAGQNQFNAKMNAFNAQSANSNNFMGGLMGLGGTLGSAYMLSNPSSLASLASFVPSDMRLKSNIKRIGTHDKLGVGIYSYEKFGKPEIGVMAQEVQKVMPDAVATHPSGYLMVDYAKV